MLESFEIINFRCFRDIKIEPFARVNLIVGSNNVGKTALLEALFLHMAANNPQYAFNLNALRGISINSPIPSDDIMVAYRWLVNGSTLNEPIRLIGKYGATERRSLEIRFSEPETILTTVTPNGGETPNVSSTIGSPIQAATLSTNKGWGVIEMEFWDINNELYKSQVKFTPTEITTEQGKVPPMPLTVFITTLQKFPAADAVKYSELEEVGRTEEVIEPLKMLEPRLKRLAVLLKPSGQSAMLWGDVGMKRLIPLPLMGQGMVHLTSIILAITQAEKGIVLIDEVENGIHHSSMKGVWKAINKAAKYHDVQIFATTHSWECICAAHEAFTEADQDDLRMFRLDSINGNVKAVAYDSEMIKTAISNNLEVR